MHNSVGGKSKNLLKMANFRNLFLLTGGKCGGTEPLTGGWKCPHAPSATTG